MIDASNFSFVFVALRGQKQSDRVGSPRSRSSLESFDTFFFNRRTASLLNPVSKEFAQPLHAPETKNKTGRESPPSSSNANGSKTLGTGTGASKTFVAFVSLHMMLVVFE